MSDYYEILGVSRTASFEEIKRAFRVKAKESHPDYHQDDPTAETRFKLVNEAYEVLKDEQKRATYDRYGHDAYTNQAQNGGFGGFHFAGGGFDDIFEEVFSAFGGTGRTRRQGPARGEDIRFDLQITLEQAYQGLKKTIEVPAFVPCTACGGKGGEGQTTCATCQGHGRLHVRQGFFAVETECPDCNGTGHKIKNPCHHCHGTGRYEQTQTLEVNIPRGVDDGVRMRLSGKGNAGPYGGPCGDLYVFLSVAEHEVFKRQGNDLYALMALPMTLAALGGKMNVALIDGAQAEIDIPAGTQTGEKVRLKGKGMPVLKSGAFGDLIISFVVQTPEHLTPAQREMLEAFAESYEKNHNTKPHPQAQDGVLDKLKGFYKKIVD